MPASPAAALIAAALIAGPAAALTPGTAPVAPAAYSSCTQQSSTSSGGQQLTPEQAKQLLAQARELVSALSGLADPRAASLASGLRGMGITPAVATGWRQQAHDLADTLMGASTDPRALQVAVTLAGAGFSPTPADLQNPTTSPTPAGPAATPAAMPSPTPNPGPAPAAPAAAGGSLVATAQSALAAAIRQVQQTAEPHSAAPPAPGSAQAAPAQGPSAQQSSGESSVQVCNSGTSDGKDPSSTSSGSGSGQQPRQSGSGDGTFGSQPGGQGSGSPGAGPLNGTAASGQKGPGAGQASGTNSWEQQAHDLAGQLATTDDPAAQQLADKLAAAGITGFAPLSSGSSSSSSTGSGTPGAGSGSGSGAAAVGPAHTAGSPSTDSGISTNGSDPTSQNQAAHNGGSGHNGQRDSGNQSSNTPGTTPAAAGDQQNGDTGQGWEQQASTLADQLAATSDPTAKQLADKLAAAGFTGSATRSDTGQPNPGGPSGGNDQAGASGNDSAARPPADQSNPAQPDPGAAGATAGADIGTWDKLAQCESGQRWDTSTGNGHHGGLQFDAATWRAYGGDQYAPTADKATKDQQIAVAEKVRDARGGYGSWPACAKRLGLR